MNYNPSYLTEYYDKKYDNLKHGIIKFFKKIYKGRHCYKQNTSKYYKISSMFMIPF